MGQDQENPRRLPPQLLDSAARAVRDPLTVVLGVSTRLRTHAGSGGDPILIQDAETIDQAASNLRLSFESLLALLEEDHGQGLELELLDLAALARECVAAGVRRGAEGVPVHCVTPEVIIESDGRLVRLLVGQLLALSSTTLRELRVAETESGASLELRLGAALTVDGDHNADTRYGLPRLEITEALAARLGTTVHIEPGGDGGERIGVSFPGCRDAVATPPSRREAGCNSR